MHAWLHAAAALEPAAASSQQPLVLAEVVHARGQFWHMFGRSSKAAQQNSASAEAQHTASWDSRALGPAMAES